MSDQVEPVLDFDPEALREKYRIERDKRLRDDGNEQYQEVTGCFVNYVDDPYAETVVQRDALFDEVEVTVIGGGFGGLLAGARLRQAGVKSIRLIEKDSDFSGRFVRPVLNSLVSSNSIK
jgi:cyclohexanone monooxygenase